MIDEIDCSTMAVKESAFGVWGLGFGLDELCVFRRMNLN